MRLTPIHRRDFIRRLKALGWDGPFSGGKHQYHQYMAKGEVVLPIPNPHGSGEISVPKLKEILNEIGIRAAEWLKVK